MCGIAGIVALGRSAPPQAAQLEEMAATLVHRGPDDQGMAIHDGAGLCMRRLAIIDVAGGRQPLYNEDRTVCVVFNGEIYNFGELREDLEARGHRFASNSDGEVIPHLWEEHGPDFVGKLNGMFGIALYDARQRRAVLVRDRLGIKPLFYAATATHVVFGSEVKAVLASGLVARELDVDALGQFVAWEYVPAPQTLLAGVRKLEPASMLIADCEKATVHSRRYWEIPPSALSSGPTDDTGWEDAVAQALDRSVKRRLIADVPLGAFLSGGVDSSLIVHGMGEARTFSIGFDDPSYNESAWSERVARHLGVSHRVEIIRPDAGELFPKLMHFMDDPIGDFSIFPTFLVSRLAREEVTVALSGDGGDELFGGYETYLAQQKARTWERVPALVRSGVAEPIIRSLRPRAAKKGTINKAKRFVEGLEHDARLEHARWRLFVGEALRRELFTEDALGRMASDVGRHILELRRRAGSRDEIDRGLFVDVHSYLVDNCLVKVDRMSMACSLEARVPFLDHEVVELAFRMPSRLKVAGGKTKAFLKRLAAKCVPRECVYRAKEGFSIPIKHWLGHELRPLMEDLLDVRKIDAEGLFRAATVDRLKREHLDGTENHSHILWAMMVFQDWRRRWSV